LLLLLGSVRTACISLVAIPLSLLTAIIVLQRLGITINTITLGGLAIALGEVVDDSIIDVENIFRRLREFRTRQISEAGQGEPPRAGEAAPASGQQPIVPAASQRPGQPIFNVVLNASLEVRRAVVFATFTVALIFLPVLTMTGLQGSFFAPLALSYILAIMASLLVALTVTPALSYLLFGKGIQTPHEPWVQRWLKAVYRKVLGFIAKWPRTLIALVIVAIAAALTRLPTSSGGLLPDFREGHFVLQVFAAPGTSLHETRRIGTRISEALLNNPNIDTVEQQIGRAELGEDPWGPYRSEFHVELKPIGGAEQASLQDEIRTLLEKFPGIQSEVTTFLGDRIGETLTGEVEPVVVNIFGPDLDVLDAKAQEIANVLNSVPGHADVKVKAPPGAPRMVIRLSPERLTQFGYRPVDVLDTVQTAYQGTIVAQTHQGNQTVDVAVILNPDDRQDPESIGSLLLTSPTGLRLPLRELADIYPTSGRPSILHEGARRRQTVTCAATGRDLGSFVAEAKQQVKAKVSFPSGTYAEFSGSAQAKEKAQRELLLNSAIAAIGILLLLSVVFHNWPNLLLVLANVPFALVGGVLAVWISGLLVPEANSLTIGSLVGFVTLFGITTRNSIMMISHFEHLVMVEGMTWGPEAALRGASERLMPILMTATVTGLGLLPLAIGTGEAGREIEGPMAIVILGGLITSTTLNLLVLPTLALRYGRFTAQPVEAD
jgi:Cu/Ag efflux pump CusA